MVASALRTSVVIPQAKQPAKAFVGQTSAPALARSQDLRRSVQGIAKQAKHVSGTPELCTLACRLLQIFCADVELALLPHLTSSIYED